jgi:hypothetical protein
MGLVLALCVVCGTAGAVQKFVTSSMAPPNHAHGAIAFVRASVVVAGANLVGRFPRGSQLMRVDLDVRSDAVGSTGAAVLLTPNFYAVADPQASFDGMRVMFSGQAKRGARWQIFEMPAVGGAARQITRCADDCFRAVYLVGDSLAYVSSDAGMSEIFMSAVSGAEAHAITFGPGKFEVETALRSGRLVVSGDGVGGARVLYVVDPDGSGLTLMRQDGAREIRSGAVELAGGAVVFVRRGVGLEWIRPGALRGVVVRGGAYASVAAWGDGMLVSREGALYRVDSGGEVLVYRDAKAACVEAVPLAAHEVVQAYRSVLHPERTTGRLLCLDAYASGDGRLAEHVARVRVLTKERDGERVLGEVPVEVDGSFYATVPADKPIRVELIGAKGEVMRVQRSWMWVRGGEDRGCVGCHESQARAPENRSPMTLQRFDTPSVLTGGRP